MASFAHILKRRVDHVNCMCQPARGQSVSFAHADTMRCVVHVEDMAEAFARVLLADKPKHTSTTGVSSKSSACSTGPFASA